MVPQSLTAIIPGNPARGLFPTPFADEVPATPANHLTERAVVLLVEDDRTVLGVCKELLMVLGYDVRTASNGREALARYHERQTAFRLVITNMVMPEMNGLQLIGELRKLDSSLPVLIITGYAKPSWINGAGRGLAEGLLQKPFSLDELAQAIDRALSN